MPQHEIRCTQIRQGTPRVRINLTPTIINEDTLQNRRLQHKRPLSILRTNTAFELCNNDYANEEYNNKYLESREKGRENLPHLSNFASRSGKAKHVYSSDIERRTDSSSKSFPYRPREEYCCNEFHLTLLELEQIRRTQSNLKNALEDASRKLETVEQRIFCSRNLKK